MSSKKNTQKTSWFKGLEREFKKIIWPDQKTLVDQSAAVVAVSIVLGVLIAIVDFVAQNGIDFLINL